MSKLTTWAIWLLGQNLLYYLARGQADNKSPCTSCIIWHAVKQITIKSPCMCTSCIMCHGQADINQSPCICCVKYGTRSRRSSPRTLEVLLKEYNVRLVYVSVQWVRNPAHRLSGASKHANKERCMKFWAVLGLCSVSRSVTSTLWVDLQYLKFIMVLCRAEPCK